MHNFTYEVVATLDDRHVDDAPAGGRPGQADVMPIAGGTELLNWMRLGIVEPTALRDIGRLPGLDRIQLDDGHLSIGALATLNAVGEDDLVQQHAAALAQACLAAASPQIRNRATLGGNLLQRTRCAYFRAEAPLPWGCNKRAPGSGCAALEGCNDRHAIFGWTDDCVATQPSDPVVALAALDAEIELRRGAHTRRVAVGDFHLTPEDAARAGRPPAAAETCLEPGELIVGYRIPMRRGSRSAYVKVRERASYEYALVSAAAVVAVERGVIASARIALGSVAMKPWRLARAEQGLVGRPPTRDEVMPLLVEALEDARPLAHNAYKVAMSAGAAARAIVTAAGATP